MNRYIRQTVLLLAILFIPCVSFAANPKKYFEKISGKNGYDYSYVSPLMLKAMSEQYLSDDKVIQFELKTSDLTSIENITAESSENVGELKKLIPEIIKDNKMETLSTKKVGSGRYDIYAHLTNDGKNITHLMVVSQKDDNRMEVVYMEGKIPIERFRYFFMY